MVAVHGRDRRPGSVTTAIGTCDDLHKGMIDRFRSLPMARSAVLSGRAMSDLVYTTGILIVLMLSGLAVGWRGHTSGPELLAGVGLMLFITFAMSWIGIGIGLQVPTVEVANQVGFMTIFPLTFRSNVFVAPETLPGFLPPIAEWNPSACSPPRCASCGATPTPTSPTACRRATRCW